MGAISPSEKKSLDSRFSETFEEMKLQEVTPLSPFLTTYLNLQSPKRFDAVIAEPRPGTSPRAGIIFLHGFGGNFTLQCWLVAAAGDQIDAITICPSTSPSGNWWNSQGQAILQETLSYLRRARCGAHLPGWLVQRRHRGKPTRRSTPTRYCGINPNLRRRSNCNNHRIACTRIAWEVR